MTKKIERLRGTLKSRLDPAIEATCTVQVVVNELKGNNGAVEDRTRTPDRDFIRDVPPTLQAGDYDLSWSGPMIGGRPSPLLMRLTRERHWIDPQGM